MRRVIKDTAGGTRTYLLELADGRSACAFVPITRTVPPHVDRSAFRMLVDDLRKQSPKVTIKRKRPYEVLDGGFKEPVKQHKGKSPFWTPLTWGGGGVA